MLGLTLFRQGFFRPSETGVGGHITLKLLTLWQPDLRRIVYALIQDHYKYCDAIVT